MNPVLKVQGIHKSFQSTVALKDATLNVYAGEVHALMGENGAGKSTLIKVITGIHSRDAGLIELSGKAISPKSNFEAQNLGISTVYQEVNLIPSLSVAENIFLGREPMKWGRIDWNQVRSGAEKALARLDLKIDVDATLDQFPIAIQQLTAIARALDTQARVLILDEATSSLDSKEVEQLFAVLRRLKEQGLAIIFVTHFLDQVYEISDRITVLRNGSFICENKIEEISRTELVSKMMGHELEKFEKEPKIEFQKTEERAWLKCHALQREGSIKPFDLEIKSGETLGLAGLLGSGRSEIAQLLFGLERATSGKLEIDGVTRSFRSPREAINHGLALCPEDRKTQSIFQGLSLRKNIILALQGHRGWFRVLNLSKQNEIANHFIQALGIRTRDADQSIETLSGGNQQKAILGRWLALEPRLLILDEPTRGIDVGAKAEIQKYILKLSSLKKSILFISSELEEVVRSCDRVAILRDRHLVAELHPPNISEASIVEAIGEAH